MCSFCVRLCGWTSSLCLSALPSYRAPDEVIRTVTGVAHLHCLYLASVSVMRCQIVITLVVSYSLCQSSRSWGCSRLVAFQYFPEGCGLDCILCPSWRLCTADDICTSTVFWSLHLHCQLIFTSTVFWSLHLHCQLIFTSTVFWSLHLHCQLIFTSTVFWSCQIKTICFHSQLDLELSVPWQ